MWKFFHKLASPPHFYRIARIMVPWFAVPGLLLIAYGTYAGLFVAPADYQQGDAFRIIYVHVPSAYLSMMEYMIMGKPIVAFDLPEHRVSAQDAAVYAEANDAMDFARRIEELMDDPDRRQSMGAIGRERVLSGLAWEHQEGNLLAAYAAVSGVETSR